ncbi:hypothetical protein [Pseudoalteromonas galatheae]|uniref:hypothetical protein n=1 Tax=Pseudoalteromonas galatheae TaxID=579562 RepID=UPI0030D3E782
MKSENTSLTWTGHNREEVSDFLGHDCVWQKGEQLFIDKTGEEIVTVNKGCKLIKLTKDIVVSESEFQEYFIAPKSAGFSQQDIDRFVIRYSYGDYPKGLLTHILQLINVSEEDFVNSKVAKAKSNFKKYGLK